MREASPRLVRAAFYILLLITFASIGIAAKAKARPTFVICPGPDQWLAAAP